MRRISKRNERTTQRYISAYGGDRKKQRIKDGVRFAIILVLTVALIFSWMFFLCRHNNETGTNSEADDKKEEIRSAVMLYEENPAALPQHGGNDSCMRICQRSQPKKKSA